VSHDASESFCVNHEDLLLFKMDIIIYFYAVCIIKMYMIYNLHFFAVC